MKKITLINGLLTLFLLSTACGELPVNPRSQPYVQLVSQREGFMLFTNGQQQYSHCELKDSDLRCAPVADGKRLSSASYSIIDGKLKILAIYPAKKFKDSPNSLIEVLELPVISLTSGAVAPVVAPVSPAGVP